jgi:hypothetical protein
MKQHPGISVAKTHISGENIAKIEFSQGKNRV